MSEEPRFHDDHADESPTIEGRLQGAFDRGLAEGRHEGVVRISQLEARAIEDATILADYVRLLDEKARRIEALEAALQEITEHCPDTDGSTVSSVLIYGIAIRALAASPTTEKDK